jgi:type VI protein secretion system component Hcp
MQFLQVKQKKDNQNYQEHEWNFYIIKSKRNMETNQRDIKVVKFSKNINKIILF